MCETPMQIYDVIVALMSEVCDFFSCGGGDEGVGAGCLISD
jgi:hypothetical protein